jgi:hypothetical protein
LKRYIPFGLCIAFLYGFFVYGFGFTMRQAAGLSLCFAFLGWNQLVPAQDRFRFMPHQVTCSPNVFLMLSDLGVITSINEFRALFPRPDSPSPWAEDNVVHFGIFAVVLAHDFSEGTEVIHFPWQNVYSASLRWECQLTAVKHRLELIEWNWSPSIFMRPVIGGYEMGVSVNAEWWERNRHRKANVLKEHAESHFGSIRLVMCVLPSDVTLEFYRRPNYQLNRSRRSELLDAITKDGWRAEAVASDFTYYGEHYEHRYMDVWTRALELN